MKNDGLKILLNFLQIILIVAAILTWDRQQGVHVVIGVAFVLVSLVHINLFRKRLKLLGKVFGGKGLRGKMRRQYQVNLLLLLLWGVAIVSGLLNFLLGGNEQELVYQHVHGMSTRVAALLTLVHGFMHSKQFGNYLPGNARK